MIDQLLEECSASGWLLNLFQVTNDTWDAQLRQPLPSGNILKGYALGSTPADAILSAIENAKEVDLTSTLDGWRALTKPDKRSMDLIEELGLIKREPVRRI